MARILIVEDDPFFAEILACTLNVEGHKTTVANNADEGVRLGLVARPEVVIADWMLRSAMNGCEVCRRIRAAWPRVKTIIITGHQEIVRQIGQCRNHVEAVVAKPFHKKEILDAVQTVLARGVRPPHIKLFDPHTETLNIQSVF